MIYLDWDKLPRPDRSGLLGVIFALGLLYSTIHILDAGECFWCKPEVAAEVQQERPRPQITWLAPTGSGGHGCFCHYDVRKHATGEVLHMNFLQAACGELPHAIIKVNTWQQPDCGPPLSFDHCSEEFQDRWTVYIFPASDIDMRYHCRASKG